MRLRLNWIGVGVFNKSVHLQFLNLHFHAHGSIFALHLHKHALGFNTAAGGQAHYFVGIISQRVRHHQLQRVKAGTVRQVHKADASLGVASSANPPLNHRAAVGPLRRGATDDCDRGASVHGGSVGNSDPPDVRIYSGLGPGGGDREGNPPQRGAARLAAGVLGGLAQ